MKFIEMKNVSNGDIKMFSKLKQKFLLLVVVGLVVVGIAGCDDSNEPEIYQDFVVQLKLKPLQDANYLVTEDPIIMALSSKHNTTLKQSFPGAEKDPELSELSLFYDLRGNGNKATIIEDYFATERFDRAYLYEYEEVEAYND